MKNLIEDIKTDLDEIFNHLHSNPEVSWKEYSTTQYIKEHLESLGCRIRTFDDCTGIVGEIGEGFPVVGVRADIDALWQEVDGEFRANHSCGHDAHMTMVLGVLYLFNKIETLPEGTIRFIFQPAEEKATGALKMVEKGVVNDVDYLYGVHLRPEQDTKNGEAAPAIYHGASRFMEGKIVGEDAHGARPHLGPNAIEVAMALLNKISHIHVDPMIPHSIKMTKLLSGGDNPNIIPGNAQFSLDLRTQSNQKMEWMTKRVINAAETVSDYYGVTIDLKTVGNLPAAIIDRDAQQIMAEAIEDTLGREKLTDPVITPGGEDFHYYPLERPHIKATILGLGCGLKPGLHHPKMTFDHTAIYSGVEILAKAVIKTLKKINNDKVIH